MYILYIGWYIDSCLVNAWYLVLVLARWNLIDHGPWRGRQKVFMGSFSCFTVKTWQGKRNRLVPNALVDHLLKRGMVEWNWPWHSQPPIIPTLPRLQPHYPRSLPHHNQQQKPVHFLNICMAYIKSTCMWCVINKTIWLASSHVANTFVYLSQLINKMSNLELFSHINWPIQ